MKKFKVGDYVTVRGNARGTIWESGVIDDINSEGAIIAYGSKYAPKYARLYGLAIRIPLERLEHRAED